MIGLWFGRSKLQVLFNWQQRKVVPQSVRKLGERTWVEVGGWGGER